MTPDFIKQLVFRVTELERQLANVITVGTVSEVDVNAQTIRLTVGETETGWRPWPVENGANYTRWKPVRKGQQFVIANPSGDPANGLIIGEIYSDDIKSDITDRFTDHVQFSNGNYVSNNVETGAMSIKADGGFKLIGDINLTGKLTSTGDQIAGGVSTMNHVHEKTMPHSSAKSGKPDQ